MTCILFKGRRRAAKLARLVRRSILAGTDWEVEEQPDAMIDLGEPKLVLKRGPYMVVVWCGVMRICDVTELKFHGNDVWLPCVQRILLGCAARYYVAVRALNQFSSTPMSCG